MTELLRRWIEDDFVLELYETDNLDTREHREYLGYVFYDKGVVIFKGEDFSPSPMDSLDSDSSVASLLGFLSLQDGDTDDEYFDHYTPEQLAWRDERAEELSYFAAELGEAQA